MYASALADAGGLLVASGVMTGLRQDVSEYLALDWSSVLAAEFLLLRFDDDITRVTLEMLVIDSLVRDWLPIRAMGLEAADRARQIDLEAAAVASLVTAEALGIPLVTTNDELR